MQTLSDSNRSSDKKRKLDQLSKTPQKTPADSNFIVIDDDFRELKKIKPNPNTNAEEAKFPDLHSHNIFTKTEENSKLAQSDIIDLENVDIKPKLESIEASKSSSKVDKEKAIVENKPEWPLLYINKLRYYPIDSVTENMVSFKEMMFADLLKDGNHKRDLEMAFMTTFGYSRELVEPLLKAGVQLFLADEWREGDGPALEKKHGGYENFTLIRPPKVPTITYGAFHPKIWILKFPKFLRVVIASGNLTVDDWTIWSNGLWYQDFPLLSDVKPGSNDKHSHTTDNAKPLKEDMIEESKTTPQENKNTITPKTDTTPTSKRSLKDIIDKNQKPDKNTIPEPKPSSKPEDNSPFDYNKDFKEVLTEFLQRIMPTGTNYKTVLNLNLDNYHFSNIDIVLIPSVAGRHRYKYIDMYGHRRVAAVLKKVAPHIDYKKKKLVLTYQTSSVGALDEKFFREMLSSFFPGYLTIEELKSMKKPASNKKEDKTGKTVGEDHVLNRVKMIYPTRKYVENSIVGPEGAGCLLLGAKTFQREAFPKTVLHKFAGAANYAYHDGCIAHFKVFVINGEDNEVTDDTIVYWGSHNFSPGAWGRYEREYSQLMITNTEMGVMLLPRKGSKERKKKLLESMSFRYPAERYGKEDEPFIFELHYRPEGEKEENE